ncbi:RepA, partial [Pseudomonas savastanoi pv. glycinea]
VRSAIATLAGVSVRTVASYTHILSEVSQPSTVSVLRGTRQPAKAATGAHGQVDSTTPQPAPCQAANRRALGVQSGV